VLLPAWILWGLVETLKGIVLGVVVSFTFLLLSIEIFPSLRDFDSDFALQLRAFAEAQVWNRSSAIAPQLTRADGGALSSDSYVFLDVDPEPIPPHAFRPPSPCDALAAAFPERYQVAGMPASTRVRTALTCGRDRPLNRLVLAELVTELQKRSAHLIVLDVDLSPSADPIIGSEDGVLLEALRKAHGSLTPLLAALPIANADAQSIWLNNHADAFWKGLPTAVALASPGEPVRRYPRCYVIHGSTSQRVPTLPYLIARRLQGHDDAAICSGDDLKAPRIPFTIPPQPIHQDFASEAVGGGQLSETDLGSWPVYRRIYNRCIAGYFWNASSLCGSTAGYAGKVVVIGASSRFRRDRHTTPLGEMTGAEIIINAARGFAHQASGDDPSLVDATIDELRSVLIGGFIWSFYFFFRSYYLHRISKSTSQARERIVLTLTFAVTFGIALVFVISRNLASFTLLLGIMGVALEYYIHGVAKLIEALERFLLSLLRLPTSTH
jgi:hypothetical protein